MIFGLNFISVHFVYCNSFLVLYISQWHNSLTEKIIDSKLTNQIVSSGNEINTIVENVYSYDKNRHMQWIQCIFIGCLSPTDTLSEVKTAFENKKKELTVYFCGKEFLNV